MEPSRSESCRSESCRNDAPDRPPLVLVEKDRGALRITALDKRAARSRLEIGMPLTEARALLPAITTVTADPQADDACLRLCAAACERFTPLVALRGKDGLVLDITGCAHLLGGEAALHQSTRHLFTRLGLTTRVTLAGTPDAAWALARFTRLDIVEAGSEAATARALPVTALDQSTETTLALVRAGLKTLGDLADRPSHLLAARFGSELVDALQRILGHEDIRITPLRAAPEIMAETHFPEPLILMDSLLAALERLAGDIGRALERRGAGGRVFEASFFRADGAVRRLRVETAEAMREPSGLMRLIRLKIGALADPLDPGFGFDALRLAVIRSDPMGEPQRELDGSAGQTDVTGEVAALVDRLVARFGRDNVRRFVAGDTHDPIHAGGTIPFLSGKASLSGKSSLPLPIPEVGSPPARPLTLFDHPQLIEAIAEVPDAPPIRFRWRRVLHEVARAEGPERIAPEWWLAGGSAPATRDYYRIEDAQGRRFWVFREGHYEDTTARPRWFVHGLFA
jgi:protein ImuB